MTARTPGAMIFWWPIWRRSVPMYDISPRFLVSRLALFGPGIADPLVAVVCHVRVAAAE